MAFFGGYFQELWKPFSFIPIMVLSLEMALYLIMDGITSVNMASLTLLMVIIQWSLKMGYILMIYS